MKRLSERQIRAAFEIIAGYELDEADVEEVQRLGGTSWALAEYMLGPLPAKEGLDPPDTTVEKLGHAVREAASRKETRRLGRWKRKRADEMFERLTRRDSEGS
jgi:hypothetical protein